MVTDLRTHAYPWLRDCKITSNKSAGSNVCKKLLAMAGIVDGVVSKSILEKAEKGAASVDWFSVPPEERLLDDSFLSWVAGFQEAVSEEFFEQENSGVENPT